MADSKIPFHEGLLPVIKFYIELRIKHESNLQVVWWLNQRDHNKYAECKQRIQTLSPGNYHKDVFTCKKLISISMSPYDESPPVKTLNEERLSDEFRDR